MPFVWMLLVTCICRRGDLRGLFLFSYCFARNTIWCALIYVMGYLRAQINRMWAVVAKQIQSGKIHTKDEHTHNPQLQSCALNIERKQKQEKTSKSIPSRQFVRSFFYSRFSLSIRFNCRYIHYISFVVRVYWRKSLWETTHTFKSQNRFNISLSLSPTRCSVGVARSLSLSFSLRSTGYYSVNTCVMYARNPIIKQKTTPNRAETMKPKYRKREKNAFERT